MTTAPAAAPPAPALWLTPDGRTLGSLLGLRVGPGSSPSSCSWSLGVLEVTATQDLEAAAWLLADAAMVLRCGKSPALELWRARARGGPPLTDRQRRSVDVFLTSAFRLPGQPEVPDHLQGYVAELLWYVLAGELAAAGRQLVHVEAPSFHVTEPGGDGLVVWELTDGMLVFRLWEIKKHQGASQLSRTVRRACQQLSDRGAEYLAKYTAVGSHAHDGALGELYAALPDLWMDADPRAGAGVSLATSADRAPKRRCFGTLPTSFPTMANGGRLEGLVLAIGDFPAFATRVQECVWSGR